MPCDLALRGVREGRACISTPAGQGMTKRMRRPTEMEMSAGTSFAPTCAGCEARGVRKRGHAASMRSASGDRAARGACARRPKAACGRLARRRERTGAATAATAVDAATWTERRPDTLRRADTADAARAASTALAAPRSCARGVEAAQLRGAGAKHAAVAPRADVALLRPLCTSGTLAALRAAMVAARARRRASSQARPACATTRAELAIADCTLAGGPTLTLHRS